MPENSVSIRVLYKRGSDSVSLIVLLAFMIGAEEANSGQLHAEESTVAPQSIRLDTAAAPVWC